MKKLFALLVLIVTSGLSFVAAQDVAPEFAPSEQVNPIFIQRTFPVTLFSDTLFFIETKVASYSAQERAASVSNRLANLYDDDFDGIKDIKTQPFGNYVDIVSGDVIIMSVAESDAEIEHVTPQELADRYVQIIQDGFEKAKKDRNIWTILIRLALVLTVLVGIWLMIALIKKSHFFVISKITRHKEKLLKDLSYKDYTFLTAEQELKIVTNLLNVLKWFVIIFLVYLLLPLIFSIFPFSRGWATTLFGFVWSPFKSLMLAVWDYLPKLFAIIVIYIVFKYLIKFVKYIFSEIEAGKLNISGFHSDWALPTFSIIRFLLYAFMFVLIFPNLPGSDSDIFKGVSVFIGILVSLGSSSAISNMVAGLVITYMRPFKLGDRIQVAGITGDVVEKTLLVTRLRTIKNEEITIPNAAVLSGNTTNYSALAKSEGLIIYTTVTIGYDVHWKIMHDALLEAASRTPGLMADKKPFVLQTSLEDFYVSYQLNVYTAESNALAPIYSNLNQHILDVCAERAIKIMSPHYLADRDSSEIKIPISGDVQPVDKKGQ